MNKILVAVSMVVVAASSSGITYLVVKEKCDKKADEKVNKALEEINILKKSEKPEVCTYTVNPDISTYDPSKVYGVDEYLNYIREKEIEDDNKKNKLESFEKIDTVSEYVFDIPQVISPDDYGEDPEYDTTILTYYSDGVLCDDWMQIINIDIIGKDSINHFGEFEENTIYVKNPKYKCYYEVSRDPDTYTEALRKYEDLYGPNLGSGSEDED